MAGLFNFLLDETERLFEGSCDVPLLLAPAPFPGASPQRIATKVSCLLLAVPTKLEDDHRHVGVCKPQMSSILQAPHTLYLFGHPGVLWLF